MHNGKLREFSIHLPEIYLFIYLIICKDPVMQYIIITLRQNINIHGLPETAGCINTSYADACIGLNDEQKVRYKTLSD